MNRQTRWFRFVVLFLCVISIYSWIESMKPSTSIFGSNNNIKTLNYVRLKCCTIDAEHTDEAEKLDNILEHGMWRIWILFICEFVSCNFSGEVSSIEWNFVGCKLTGAPSFCTLFNCNHTISRSSIITMDCKETGKKTLDS